MHRFTRSLRPLLAIALVPASATLARGDGLTLAFEDLPTDVPEACYVLPLPDASLAPGTYRADAGGSPAFVQVFDDGGQRFVAARLREVSELTIDDQPLPSAEPRVLLQTRGADVDVSFLDQPFTTYRGAEAHKPYFFPVIGPTGQPITRAYPMEDVDGEDRDHPHQRSFWFTHGNVNGIDFWAADTLNGDKPQFGKIVEREKVSVLGGPLVGILRTRNDWLDHDGKKVLSDERIVRFHESRSPRVIDFEITLTAGDAPVTFGETKEGSFGLRVASTMDVKKQQGGRITNAEGITDIDAWGKKSPWVDYTGPVGGKVVGIAILNHPSSFRYPTSWHVRDYGLFAANPFGYKDFGIDEPGEHTLPASDSIRLGYRVILHEGTTDEARIADAFRAYSANPRVTVKPR